MDLCYMYHQFAFQVSDREHATSIEDYLEIPILLSIFVIYLLLDWDFSFAYLPWGAMAKPILADDNEWDKMYLKSFTLPEIRQNTRAKYKTMFLV